MPAGRPPKPLEIQYADARGDGKRPDGRPPKPVVVIEPFDPAKVPAVPAGLEKRGTTEWLKVWESGPWLHPQEDYRWVEMLARAYDEMEAFRERIEEEGLVVIGYAGQPAAHPLIREIRECEKVIMKCLSTLGFSPTDRARLGLAEIKRQTGLADLQNRTRNGAR